MKLTTRRAMTAGLTLVAGALVSIGAYHLRMTAATIAPTAESPPSVQQQRRDELTNDLAARTNLAEAREALHGEMLQGTVFDLTSAATATAEGSTLLILNAVIADRRVARIEQFLSEMPAAQARADCRATFEHELEDLTSQWKRSAPLFKSSKYQVMSLFLRQISHRLSAAVFLAALHCPAEDVVAMIARWRESAEAALMESEFDVEEYTQRTGVALRDVFPEQLFELNIYAVLLKRAGCSTLETVERSRHVSVSPTRPASFLAWDSGPGSQKVLATIPLLYGWSGIRPGESRDRMVDAARDAVIDCVNREKSSLPLQSIGSTPTPEN